MSPFLAELLGTMLLVLLGDGVVANVVLNKTKGHNSGWIVITAGWALGVTVAVYAVGTFSGAHLNPAVTIGLASIGKFAWASVTRRSVVNGAVNSLPHAVQAATHGTMPRCLTILTARFVITLFAVEG